MKFSNLISFFVFLVACGSADEESTPKETQITEEQLSLPDIDSIIEATPMEELYGFLETTDPCFCDVCSNFDLSGEGEVFPLEVYVDGELREYDVNGAHITGWDGEEYFYVDSLEDGTVFDIETEAKVHMQLGYKTVWLNEGPAFAWPDENSEEVFRLSTDSNGLVPLLQ